MNAPYRQAPSLLEALERHLGPMGFVTVAPDDNLRELGVLQMYRRKNWNTNRGVAVARLGSGSLPAYVEVLRNEVGRGLGSSWWNQLGLQLVIEMGGPPAPRSELAPLVAKVNTQGVLVQSVSTYERTTGAFSHERTWGQVITGRFQDGICAALEEVRLAQA